jgi:exonuclease VII small subunit
VKALKECLADLDEAELTVNDLDETLIDLEKTVEALEQKL